MRVFFLFFVFGINLAFGQVINCEEILNKQPNFLKKTNVAFETSFAEDVKILKHCGNFSEADSLLFKGPMLGSLMIKLGNRDSLTYGKIITALEAEKNNDDYRDFLALQELGAKKVSQEISSRDKQILSRVFDSSTRKLNKFNDFILKNQNLTYKEAIVVVTMAMGEIKIPETGKTYEFKPLVSYENALMEAKKANKKLLLFFSAYGDVNSERMKEDVFMDPEVKNRLSKNFISFKAYVDESKELPAEEHYFSKTLNKKILTVGQKFIDLQLTKFKSSMEPHFIILATNGKVIKQKIGYQNKQRFLSFLQ